MAGTATRSRRLSRSADFDAVYRRGRSASSRHLVVYAFARDPGATASEPRVGLTVSRKVGGSVERNRVKRLLREASARVTPGLAADVDLVIVARPGLAEALGRGAPRLARGRGARARRARRGEPGVRRVALWLLLAPIYTWRFVVHALVPGGPATCRFEPSCSRYAEEAIRTHGAAARLAGSRCAGSATATRSRGMTPSIR